MRIIFVRKENSIQIYSAILLPELPSSTILESIRERNQRNERCLHSACALLLLNVNNAHYIDYVLITPDVTWTILQMSLLRFCALIVVISLLSMECQKALRFYQKYLNLSYEDEGLTGLGRHEGE